jgi:hypothetical protein
MAAEKNKRCTHTVHMPGGSGKQVLQYASDGKDSRYRLPL